MSPRMPRAAFGVQGLAALMSGADPARAAMPVPEAFQDPHSRLDAFVRVEGDASGELVVQHDVGSVYSFFDGVTDRRLFDTERFALRRYRRIEAGWLRTERAVTVYRDPESHRIIAAWKNPWLERSVDVIDLAQESSHQFSVAELGKSYDIGVTIHEDDVFVQHSSFAVEASPITPLSHPLHGQDDIWEGSDFLNFFCRLRDVNNRKLARVPAVSSYNRVSSLLPWLEMGDVASAMIVQTRSEKLKRVEELPRDLLDHAIKLYPTYLALPAEATLPPPVSASGMDFYKAEIARKSGPVAR